MKLNKLRAEITKNDKTILKLLNQRTKLALEIGTLKKKMKTNVYSPEREENVYRALLKNNKGPLPKESLKAIYREIMSSAIGLQKKLVISYLGPEATFTHQAARSKFGSSVDYFPSGSISGIFNAVEKGYADYGVVPIENSIEGAVNHTLDVFINSPLVICSEILLKISHNLLSRKKGLSGIKKVYSNPQVFGQCRQWLRTNLSDKVELINTESTAQAAMIAAVKDKNSAAIASTLAADLYKLHLVARDIEDITHNTTRFLVIGNKYAGYTGKDKTSIMFSAKDRVGVLYDILAIFKKSGINLTKIESRPSKKKPWEYYFFVDFNRHCDEKDVKGVFKQLKKYCVFIKILGSYPQTA